VEHDSSLPGTNTRHHCTVKLKGVELLPPGLITVTIQVPVSLASLNDESLSWPELTEVVLLPG
jgi:hypothetical protein